MDLKRKQTLCIALLLLDDEEEEAEKKRARRSIWVKPWLQRRAELGIYSNLHFDHLVERLYPCLIKQDTIMKESIKPSEQCCLFLRWVARGGTFRSLEYQYRVSRRSIARIVERVAEAIIEEFEDEYLKTSNTVSKWLEISENFSQRWTFLTRLVLLMGSI